VIACVCAPEGEGACSSASEGSTSCGIDSTGPAAGTVTWRWNLRCLLAGISRWLSVTCVGMCVWACEWSVRTGCRHACPLHASYHTRAQVLREETSKNSHAVRDARAVRTHCSHTFADVYIALIHLLRYALLSYICWGMHCSHTYFGVCTALIHLLMYAPL